MIKKIAISLFYILIPLGIFVLLGFAEKSNLQMDCNRFSVYVSQSPQAGFLDSVEIRDQINRLIGEVEGKTLKEISLIEVEEYVNKMYYVEEAQVYRTIDGELVVNAIPRKPLARIINMHNESYYIDTNGMLMKVSRDYTARVMIVSGYIAARYSPVLDLNMQKDEEDIPGSEQLLRDLNQVILHLNSNPFFQAWVDQIYITPDQKFELIPINGTPVVELGKAENIEEKLDKLFVFYKNGLSHVGWNHYKKINLNFENQIICSK